MKSEDNIKIHSNLEYLSKELANEICRYIKYVIENNDIAYISLSGGRTPKYIFREIVKDNPDINWSNVRIFWLDERCVPPENDDSNFGLAQKEFLSPLRIPESSFFRIKGENDSQIESIRYSEIIRNEICTSDVSSIPVFDLMLLGIGSDGHVASIFPDQIEKWNEKELCTATKNPASGQHRVSFTGQLINSAKRLYIMASGVEKAKVINEVMHKIGNYKKYPISLIEPINGELFWHLDEAAAEFL